MKRLIILLLFASGYSVAYTQDSACLEKVISQGISIKDLQTKVERLQHDSLLLKNEFARLQKDSAVMQKSMAEFNKSKIKTENDTLKKRLDHQLQQITGLSQELLKKDNAINIFKNDSIKNAQEQYNNGQQQVYAQIARMYQSKSFDELVAYSTKASVERDSTLIGNNTDAKQKLWNLQKYFDAQQVLEEKYNEQKVKNATDEMNTIPGSDKVKNLIEKLRKYKLCNDGLKVTVDSIRVLDKKVANSETLQTRKKQEVLIELSGYFYNYFSFSDYPYLSDIVLEIIKRKQKDANADLTDLSSKL